MQHARTDGQTRAKAGLRRFAVVSFSFFFLILLLAAPASGLAGARLGLSLCAEIIIPSLFPFLALSSFIIQTGLAERVGRLLDRPTAFLFHLPGAAAPALVLGILGGYPVGAGACALLVKRKTLTRAQGERLLAFCINSSPAYIIGAVGTGLLHSAKAGALLYLAHIASSLLLGILLGLREKGTKSDAVPRRPAPALSAPGALVASVTGAADSIVGICGFVVFFSALSELFFSTGLLDAAAALFSGAPLLRGLDAGTLRSLLKGFLEVSGGCAAAAENGRAVLPLLSAFLSWSGVSVIFQVLYSVRGSGVSARRYVLCRPAHLALSVALTLLLFSLFPVSLPAMAGPVRVVAGLHAAPASAALLFTCAMLLLARAGV